MRRTSVHAKQPSIVEVKNVLGDVDVSGLELVIIHSEINGLINGENMTRVAL